MDLNGKLSAAAKAGDTEGCVKWINKGANINAVDERRYTPVHYAAEAGHTDAVMALLENCGNARAYFGMIALHSAAKGGQRDTVHELIMSGFDANTLDSHEYTPLHVASEKGHVETVKKLLEHGARNDITANKFRGETALHRAAGAGRADVVVELIYAGAVVNKKDQKGATALHYAAEDSRLASIEVLVRSGANVNAPDNNGWAPLHFASKGGHTDAVNLLLDHGADVNAKDYVFRQGPIKYASDGGHTATILALVNRGAKTSKQKPLSGPKG